MAGFGGKRSLKGELVNCRPQVVSCGPFEVSHLDQPNCLVDNIVTKFKITENDAGGCVVGDLDAQALSGNSFQQSSRMVARDNGVRPRGDENAPLTGLIAR